MKLRGHATPEETSDETSSWICLHRSTNSEVHADPQPLSAGYSMNVYPTRFRVVCNHGNHETQGAHGHRV